MTELIYLALEYSGQLYTGITAGFLLLGLWVKFKFKDTDEAEKKRWESKTKIFDRELLNFWFLKNK